MSGGETLAARYYPARGDAATGLVWLHSLGDSPEAWANLPARAAQEGFPSLVLTLPGHEAGAETSWRAFSDDEWAAVSGRIAAALGRWEPPGGGFKQPVFIGSALGASIAMEVASVMSVSRGAVLVSPGLSVKSLALEAPVARFHRPILLIAAEGDSYAAASSTALKEAAPAFCELRLYPGTANGEDLLVNSENAQAQLWNWLETITSE